MKQYFKSNPLVTLLSFLTLFSSPILIACSPAISNTIATKSAEPVTINGMEKDILGYINQHRRSIGRSSLQMVSIASQQAYNHSRNMALRKTGFGHDGFEQRMAVVSSSEGQITASAENVAYGNLSAEAVVKGWLKSPGHKRNIENDYAFTGIGVYKDNKGVLFFTQIFFRKS